MSVKAMWMMIQKIHAESHVSRLFILCDMVWCAVHYGVGYLESVSYTHLKLWPLKWGSFFTSFASHRRNLEGRIF